MTSWGDVRREVEARLNVGGIANAANEARWLCEEASGFEGAEWLEAERVAPIARAAARLERMVRRRVEGEPLQYVLGRWSFRGIDLMVDARVLIPRPETEWVVEIALRAALHHGLARGRRSAFDARPGDIPVLDLGTGSGAIALALAAELPEVVVWATDVSLDAVDVARANVAGAGQSRVRVEHGSWFDPLPEELRSTIPLIVANPPYISEAEHDGLPREVINYEPGRALFSGPTGLECIEAILSDAPGWLRSPGAVVIEIAPHQAQLAIDAARSRGFSDARVEPDLTGRPRALVATTATDFA